MGYVSEEILNSPDEGTNQVTVTDPSSYVNLCLSENNVAFAKLHD